MLENHKLEDMNRMFTYEKLSRDIDNLDDIDSLKVVCKDFLKLYLIQQESIINLGKK
jgi:hypothetical protein